MRIQQPLVVFLLISTCSLFAPSTASAGPEVTLVLGAMIGDSLKDVLQVRPSELTGGFSNAPIFGGRLGWSAFPFAFEGSLVYSPSSINVDNVGSLDANLAYAEAEVQILILPGPVAPFIAAGIGIHSIQLQAGEKPRETTVGYIFGGGLKVAIGSLGIRADLRDHITPLDATTLGDEFLRLLGTAESTSVHNVELSGGLTIRF